LLSSDGFIYAFGSNSDGELGNQKAENGLSPQTIKIEAKFIDISSHWTKEISIALSQDGIYYNWGKCGEKIIRTPKPTNFKSFVEIHAKHFKITHKSINFEDQNSVPISLQNKYKNEFSEQNSAPILLQDKYVNEFSEQSLISSGECIQNFKCNFFLILNFARFRKLSAIKF
jgi:alpha-tubulin suppressor-like RCC1 family protein